MNNKNINLDEVQAIVDAVHINPHHLLGIHKTGKSEYVVNVFQPYAKTVFIENMKTNRLYEMKKIHDHGFFTVTISSCMKYKLHITDYDNNKWQTYDPYNFDPIISDFDLYLFNQGTHYDIYNKLGAHPITVGGVEGVMFAVWAPNAQRVSVIGSFNNWDGRVHPMRLLGNSGVYELFIPGLQPNDMYKFEILTKDGSILKKSDPYGNYAEVRPSTASVVADLNKYQWHDEKWLGEREYSNSMSKPISIYEVHLGSWKKNGTETGYLSYRELAHDLVDYVKEMGYTHIELLPISEHPYDGSWGYQVVGYYAPTSRFGTPEDFMYFVDYCHQNSIGVILDWVPGHFPKDDHGLIKFDGSSLYEYDDPRKGEHPHWGTMIFNYGRYEVKNFLVANALFWLDKFHIDGLRVDAVASMLYLDYGKEDGEWIPNIHGGTENYEAVEFLKHMNSVVHGKYPGIMMIAEESTSWTGVSRAVDMGGLGFGFKWNMGWMNDFLVYIEKDSIHRKYHHNNLTFSMVYAYTENFILPFSHDEVVHGKNSMIGKMPGDYWQKFANLRATYGFKFGHPGKKLLFMGCEFAQFDEWNEQKSLDWHLLDYDKHREMQTYVKDLNHLYHKEATLWIKDYDYDGFEWINCSDKDESIVSFFRRGETDKDIIVFVCNFTPVPRTMHRIGVPKEGSYVEILNSDDLKYGGSGIINTETLHSMNLSWDGREYSIGLKVPPLGISILKFISN